jgi:uncharacterized membrane protein (DUF2068 family)
MPRSVGITVSAVVVLIGSALTIFFGAMMVLASAFLLKLRPAGNVPAISSYVVLAEAAMFLGFGAWGLATGIGLIKLKQWGRISTLVYAGILVVISLPAAVVVAVIPLRKPSDPNLPSNFMAVVHVGLAIFYGVFAGLGVYWLYFFNRRNVKAQFQGRQPAVEQAASDLPSGSPVNAQNAGHRTRPLSITIIGWYLLAGSALAPLFLSFYSTFFPDVQFPLCFLGFFFFGRSADLILIAWAVAQMAAAVGLLKLKNWGLFATIGLQCLAVINVVLLVAIPSNRARFQHLMETMIASMSPRMSQPIPLVIPMWAGMGSSLPIIFVILWFLVTRRQAFTTAAEDMARKI